MDKKHLYSLSLTLIFVMLFSAMGPTTVYAQDGTPTDAPTAEASNTDGETVEEGATEEQVDETAASDEVTEELPADETGEEQVDGATAEEGATEEQVDETAASDEVTEELPADETAEEGGDDAPAEEPSLMEQVPENTEVVVLNADGEAEPLATQEAADAVVESDPIWCPGSQAPTPGANGCTDSYSSFDALLTFLKDNEGDTAYQSAGTIYVEMGDYGGGESAIDFNTYGFTSFENNDLTIQGGWNTSTGTTGETTGDTSNFDIPIVIGSEANPWNGSVTIYDIIITGVKSGVANVPALAVYSEKDVTVRRSKINNNGSDAQEVEDGKGLEIKAGRYVSLSDVEANDNQIFGARIEAGDVVSIENSFFNGNLMYTLPEIVYFGEGLTVVSQGDIALLGVEANGNFLWGASLTGPNVDIRESKFNENISDSDIFIDDTGLLVVSPGTVFLRDVEANDNRLIGADIQAGGDITIRDSEFNRNFGTTEDGDGNETHWGYGLQAVSTGGQISLITVQTDDNYLFGTNLDAATDVVITSSSFSRNVTPVEQANSQGGLMIQSGGEVTLSTVTVNENGLFGADIVASGDIRSDGSSYFNNGGSGLIAKSNGGSIYLDNVIASSNGVDGAYLETTNRYVCITGGNYVSNSRYNAQIINSTYEVIPTIDNIFTSGSASGECPQVTFTSPSAGASTGTSLTQGQLPAPLNQGNAFVSALQVSVSGTITLHFPIPAGMEGADLAVMFWNGSGWVEVPGGSVVGSEFVITVTQPGIYVLVSKQT